MLFTFRAVSASGEVLRGEMDAPTSAGVVAHLHAQGAVPLQVSPGRRAWRDIVSARITLTGGRVAARDIAQFCARLATLCGAGVPVESAVAILGGGDGGPAAAMAADLLRRLRAGAQLAEAMEAAQAFSPLVVSLVRAGELGGSLPATLLRLGEYLRRSEEQREAIRSALIYPAILLAAASASVLIVFTAVLPALRPVVESGGAPLPLPVQLAFGISDLVAGFWWAILLVILGVTIALRRFLSSRNGRRRRDALLLRLPLVRDTVIRADFARFARTLGTMTGGGVPMPTAMEAAQRVVSNLVLADALAAVAEAVREGGGLAEPLEGCGLFPVMAIQIVRIGEATAQLDRMLLQLAEILDQDVRRDLARALTLLVPLLTVALGLMVAGIVASVMLAVLSIDDLAR